LLTQAHGGKDFVTPSNKKQNIYIKKKDIKSKTKNTNEHKRKKKEQKHTQNKTKTKSSEEQHGPP
jgi:proteasome assembly chaperone (PAC2) family protein